MADFTATSRLFEVTAETPTEFKVRVTGHLLFNGVEIETESTTFTVTVIEYTEPTVTTSESTDDTTSTSANETCAISFSDVTKKAMFPRYELKTIIDPYTSKTVEYTVTIPEKLAGLFVYEESDLLIYSKVDITNLDIPT